MANRPPKPLDTSCQDLTPRRAMPESNVRCQARMVTTLRRTDHHPRADEPGHFIDGGPAAPQRRSIRSVVEVGKR